MANVKGILVEIGGDTSGLQKALKDVNSSSSSLSKELKGINSLLKLDPKNTELVAQKQKVLKEEISKTEDKLKLLKDAQKQVDETIKNGGEVSQENYRKLQREIAETEIKLRNFKVEASNWTKAGRSIEEFGEKITNISDKLDTLGSTVTTKLTLPTTAIAAGMVKATSNFDTSMKQVAATMGITKKEIESGSKSYQTLEKAALKCGETTKYSAGEAADALNYLALAGYDAEKSAEVLPKVLNLAAAGGLELATASDMVTDAMSALGLETKDLDKYINEMAKTSQKSNTSVGQLGEATLVCAGTAKLANMSLETMNSELGILANNGIKGAEGGTHLRNILLSLTTPTDSAAKALKKLGINVTDNKGNIRDLNDIMKDFNQKMDKMSDKERTNIISKIFNKTDISAVNALIKGSGEEFSKLKDQVSKCDNAAQNMADTMNSSFEGELTLVKSQIEGISIKFGNKMLPTLKKGVKWISDLADKFSKLSDEQIETIIKTAGFVAAIGPAIKITATLGKGIGAVSKGVGIFSEAVAVAGNNATSTDKSVNGLANGMKFLKSGAGIVTIALTAVVATMKIVDEQVKKETQSTRDFIDELENSVNARKGAIDSIKEKQSSDLAEIDNTKKLADELKNLADENGNVKEANKGRAEFILGQLNEALGTEYKMNGNQIQQYQKLKDEIDSVIQKKKASLILESQEDLYKEAITNKQKAYKDFIKTQEELTNVQKKLNDLQRQNGELGTKNGADVYKWHQEVKTLKEQQEKLTESLETQNKTLEEYGNDISTYEKNCELMLNGSAESLKQIEQSVYDTHKQITQNADTELGKRLESQIDFLNEQKKIYNLDAQYNKDSKDTILADNVDSAQKNLEALKQELVDHTSTVEGQIGQDVIDAWKKLSEKSFTEYIDAVSKLDPETRKEIDKLVGVIDDDTSVQTSMGDLGDRAADEFNKNDSKTWGEDMVAGIGKGIESKSSSNWFTNILSGTAGKIASFLHFSRPDVGPLREYEKWMPDMIHGLSETLENASPELSNSAEKIAQKIRSQIKELQLPEIKDFGKLQAGLSNQVTNSTKTYNVSLNFYPQKMTDAELNNAYEFVNKKLGKEY